jgi:hypothetical protein
MRKCRELACALWSKVCSGTVGHRSSLIIVCQYLQLMFFLISFCTRAFLALCPCIRDQTSDVRLDYCFSGGHAFTVGAVSSVVGVGLLTQVDPIVAALGLGNIALYSIAYTFMKRTSIYNTVSARTALCELLLSYVSFLQYLCHTHNIYIYYYSLSLTNSSFRFHSLDSGLGR